MCFKNLPVEFDEDGNAHLVLYPEDTAREPAVPIEDSPEKLRELLVRNGWLPEEETEAPAVGHVKEAV